MSAWAAKRFWKEATVVKADGGYCVELDARSIKTPAKTLLVVPTRALAEAIAKEWDAQEGKVKPETMPVTRMANSALDKVMPQFAAVADMLAAYGGSDLLCYRATYPDTLIARQAERWDPVLHWAKEALGAPLKAVSGIMHEPQDEKSLKKLSERVFELSPYELAAFHDLVAISGSLILALAVTVNWLTAEEAWSLSRLDEDWQVENWGSDDEATELEEKKRSDFMHAAWFYGACTDEIPSMT